MVKKNENGRKGKKKQAGRLLGRQAAITRGERKESIESRIACQKTISVEEEEGVRRKRLERLWALTRSISIITQAKAVGKRKQRYLRGENKQAADDADRKIRKDIDLADCC